MSHALLIAFVLFATAMFFTRGQGNRRGPMTFTGAAMFQWVNVKGRAAAGLALSGLYGRMMPQCAMREKGFPSS
jgi:hypothetical protein